MKRDILELLAQARGERDLASPSGERARLAAERMQGRTDEPYIPGEERVLEREWGYVGARERDVIAQSGRHVLAAIGNVNAAGVNSPSRVGPAMDGQDELTAKRDPAKRKQRDRDRGF